MLILSVKNGSHTEYGVQRTVWMVKNLKKSSRAYLLDETAMQCDIFRCHAGPEILMHSESTQHGISNGHYQILNTGSPQQSASQESTCHSCYSRGRNLMGSIMLFKVSEGINMIIIRAYDFKRNSNPSLNDSR